MHDQLPTPEDIVVRTFTTTRFRRGYDQDEVDNHLDALVEAMRARAAGESADQLPRSSQASGIAFTTTRWRDGYDPDEVDDFLALVQQAMERLEATGGPSGSGVALTGAEPSPFDHTRSVGHADLVTAAEIAETIFPTVRFESGYDQDEVDTYLDRCIEALRSMEHGVEPGAGAATGAEVRVKRFAVTSFRDGYAMADVDAFLARTADTLDARAI